MDGTGSDLRLTEGVRRGQRIRFFFEGREMAAYRGETVAGALLAEGVRTLRRAAGGTQGLAAGGIRGLAAGGTQGLAASGDQGLAAGGTRGLAAGGNQGRAASGDEGRVEGGGQGRGLFCGMGICFECRMEIDGQPNRRACMTPVAPEMKVARG